MKSNSNIVEHFSFIPSNLSKGDIVILLKLDDDEDVKVGCVDDDADDVVFKRSLKLVKDEICSRRKRR